MSTGTLNFWIMGRVTSPILFNAKMNKSKKCGTTPGQVPLLLRFIQRTLELVYAGVLHTIPATVHLLQGVVQGVISVLVGTAYEHLQLFIFGLVLSPSRFRPFTATMFAPLTKWDADLKDFKILLNEVITLGSLCVQFVFWWCRYFLNEFQQRVLASIMLCVRLCAVVVAFPLAYAECASAHATRALRGAQSRTSARCHAVRIFTKVYGWSHRKVFTVWLSFPALCDLLVLGVYLGTTFFLDFVLGFAPALHALWSSCAHRRGCAVSVLLLTTLATHVLCADDTSKGAKPPHVKV